MCFFLPIKHVNTQNLSKSWISSASLLLKMFLKQRHNNTTTTSVVSTFPNSNCLVSWAPAPTASDLEDGLPGLGHVVGTPPHVQAMNGRLEGLQSNPILGQKRSQWDDPPSTKIKNPFWKPITILQQSYIVLPNPRRITINTTPKFNSSPLKNDASRTDPFLSANFRGSTV